MNKEIAFIERTLSILKQYESTKEQYDISYAHTLFINCCVGLLMIPKEKVYDELDDNETLSDWGINPNHIELSRDRKSPRQLVRHLRNSIAHDGFDFKVESVSTPIESVTFTDDDHNFKATLDFVEFKDFVLRVVEETLELLSEKK